MLCIVGTVPSEDFPLTEGPLEIHEEHLQIGSATISVNRGTPALLAAAVKTSDTIGVPRPVACLAGDIGTGIGSRRLYQHLADTLSRCRFQAIVFHYLQPIIHWHKKLQTILGTLNPRPKLIADAGFMYVAKMSGKAVLYDLFTPDVGELSFLADEEAPHPFYTRGFILHEENRVPDLITQAYLHGNSARYLLVKGKKDYVADDKGILETVDSPVEEALEAIGGTGDTLTGIVSVLIDAGMRIPEAASIAMRANRLAGYYAQPTPATQINEIIQHIPDAIRYTLAEGSK